MGLSDNAFNTSGFALDGPGPNNNLVGTNVLEKFGKLSSIKEDTSFESVKTFLQYYFKLNQ